MDEIRNSDELPEEPKDELAAELPTFPQARKQTLSDRAAAVIALLLVGAGLFVFLAPAIQSGGATRSAQEELQDRQRQMDQAENEANADAPVATTR